MATCCGKMSSGNFILTKAPLVMGFGTGVSCILPWGGSHHCPLWAATGNQRCHTVQGSAIWETASKDNSGPGSWARPSHPVSVFTSLRQEKPSSFHVPRSWRQMGFRVPKALGNSEPVTISLDGVSHRSSCRSHFRASDNIRGENVCLFKTSISGLQLLSGFYHLSFVCVNQIIQMFSFLPINAPI